MIARDNPYQPYLGKVTSVVAETPTVKTFALDMKDPLPFRAGQFVQLTLPGVGEAPFTPSSSPLKPERMELTVIRTGSVTNRLHDVEAGDVLGVRGPFGKGYAIDKYRGKNILVVGGGCGLAPLRSLIYVLMDSAAEYGEIAIRYGAREPDELVYRSSYDAWAAAAPNITMEVTVDAGGPGWDGKVGVVTALLDDLDIDIGNTVAFSCGPEVMLRFVTLKLLEVGFEAEQIYLSMNRRMSCGMGKCGRCNIGPYYLCKDGPDMNFALLQHYKDVF